MRKVTPPEVRFWAKVEKTEGCWYWTGAKYGTGYGAFVPTGAEKPRSSLAHRFAYELMVGPIGEGLVIDHRCHTRHCVRPDHLRAVTPSQNMQNRAGLDANNCSGYRGVSWNSEKRKWLATANSNGVHCSLGYYDSEHDAGLVALGARLAIQTHNDLDRALQAAALPASEKLTTR